MLCDGEGGLWLFGYFSSAGIRGWWCRVVFGVVWIL